MIRFFNGRLLSMDGGLDITEDEVWTDGDKICYVGPQKDELPAFGRQIDLKGKLLMPGFKNAHTHSGMSFCRSLADDVPLQPWLFEQIFPLEAKLTPERVYAFTRLAVLEYLSGGVTAAFDMYYHRAAIAAACVDSGFRCVLCGTNGTPEAIEDEFVRFNSYDKLISLLPSIHAEYTTSLEDIKAVAELAKRHKAPFFTHNAETKKEVDECVARHGLTPTELFDSLGMFEYGGGGFHCVWFSEHDIEIFKKRGLWVISCPASNAKLASGIAPLARYQAAGLNIALGTDGPSSNNGLDMFREMYLACVLQKLQNMDAAACDAGDILLAACSGGARAIGLGDCDRVAPGKQADLIVIDLDQPNMRPIINIPKNLVYSGSRENVVLTMVAGRVLYENGEYFVGAEPGKIYEDAERELKAMLNE
ncbi:MAG: amidohydrolase [Oscillospiraceae bacterium]|nr:amidohydrolase [Oscillospiraceae bacterium]